MSSTIGTVYVQVEPSTKNFGSALHGAVEPAASSAGSSSGSAFGKAFAGGAKIAGVALTATTAAVGAFAKASISAGAGFDSAMSQVAATMGFSVAELNDAGSEAYNTMQQLGDFAKNMGSTTAFSASEAAEALNYMALAGYDASQSMEMLPTVLNLAAAGGIDLAAASDMVTDAQSALGLSMDEAATMVDQMAAASSKSNTSVAQLGEAFLTIGANAKSLSGGTTELATALGLLADNGIKGAEGGTHLRNIMMSLNPTTKEAKEAWDALGISAYDADGNLRPLQDTFADLNKATAEMTDQEKSQILTKMFNKTDLASVNALLATSAERWDELSEAIGDSADASQVMAEVQLDNLTGDITLFKSALEGAQIAISEQLTPSLREFVTFGSDGLSKLTQAFTEGGIGGAMDAFGEILSDGLALIVSSLPKFISAGMSLLESLGRGIIANLPMITQTALDVVKMLVDSLIANLGSIVEAGLQIILQLAVGIGEALPELIPQIVEVITNICIYLLENIDLIIDAGFQLLGGLAVGIVRSIPIILQKLPSILMGIVNYFVSMYGKLQEVGNGLIEKMAAGISAAWSVLQAKVADIANKLVNAFKTKIEEFKAIGKNIVEGIKQGFEETWSSVTSAVSAKIGSLVSMLKDLLGIHSPSKVMAEEVGQWIPAGIAQGISDGMGELDDTVKAMTTSATMNAAVIAGSADYSTYTSGVTVDKDSEVADLLRQYLPQIAKGGNVTIQLEGDARTLFNAMRKQNNDYMRSTGRSAFA